MNLPAVLIAGAARASDRRRQRALDALSADGVYVAGVGTYGTPTIRVWRRPDGINLGGRVEVGKYVSIADRVEIFTGGEHRTDWVTTYPFRERLRMPGAGFDGHPRSKGDVVIGSDVWIGAGATLLSGTHIGDGAVVGARAVVSGSIAPYSIVAGNPARLLGMRFSERTVEALLRIRWWDWPDDVVQLRVSDLCQGDIERFVAKYDPQPAAAQ